MQKRTLDQPATKAEMRERRQRSAKELGDYVTFTCDDCRYAPLCDFAFDGYNTNGDCLAEK